MRRIVWTAALLALAPPLWASAALQDKTTKPDQPGSPAEELRKRTREAVDGEAAAIKAYYAAKTNEDRRAAIAKRPAANLAPKLLELVEKAPDAPEAPEALTWIVTRNFQSPDGTKALAIILDKYITSDKIGPICQYLGYIPGGEAEGRLRTIIEKNQHPGPQGYAKTALAEILKQRADGRTPGDPKKASEECESLLGEVVERYGDIQTTRGTLKDVAEPILFEIRHLGIGKSAPEIDGEDIDGKKFKLSDYRGKVVVLDFWGHW
jgi:hypothetical protein